MNLGIVACIISAIYAVAKGALTYSSLDIKSIVQDTVAVFASALVGLFGYDKYMGKPAAAKVAAVFTEKPSF